MSRWTQTLPERFWAKVNKRGPFHPYLGREGGRCWLWTGGTRRGYGEIWVEGRPKQAHIVAWEMHQSRPVTGGLELLHSCDRRRCVNVAHLREGTRSENVREMHERGRANLPRGENHWNYKPRPPERPISDRALPEQPPPTIDDIRAWLAARRPAAARESAK